MRYRQINKNFLPKFIKLIKQSKNIVITGHVSPDDDSISSVLALYHYISSKYSSSRQIRMIQTGIPNFRFQTFLGFDKIEFVSDLANYIDGVDLIIFLDGSQYGRFTTHPEAITRTTAKTICIDHHSSPCDSFTLSLVSSKSAATAELIYKLFCLNSKINRDISEIILLGILGDTGTFNYLKPDNIDLLVIASRLLKVANIEVQEFKSRYQTIPVRVFEIIKEFIKNTQFHQLPNDQSFQLSFITREFIESGQYSDNETSDAGHIYVSHYLRCLDGYKWGFVLRPKTTETSLSLRSLPGSINVRDIVERMGIGGGHDRAAGGKIPSIDIEDSIAIMLDWISKNKLTIS